jgi:hypothetical protein
VPYAIGCSKGDDRNSASSFRSRSEANFRRCIRVLADRLIQFSSLFLERDVKASVRDAAVLPCSTSRTLPDPPHH